MTTVRAGRGGGGGKGVRVCVRVCVRACPPQSNNICEPGASPIDRCPPPARAVAYMLFYRAKA